MDTDEYVIERIPKGSEITLSVRKKGQDWPSVTWDPERRFLGLSLSGRTPRGPHAGVALSELVPELAKLLVRLQSEVGATLAGGRFFASLDYFTYPEFAERLARHALERGDYQSGQRAAGGEMADRYLNAYIRRTAGEPPLMAELHQILSPAQLRPVLRHVEKCSSGSPSGNSEIALWLRQRGFTGAASLPVGCLMGSFQLEPLPVK